MWNIVFWDVTHISHTLVNVYRRFGEICTYFLRVIPNVEENNTYIVTGTAAVGSVRDHVGLRRMAKGHETLERVTS
jgi:hypothetical protein